MAVCFSKAIDFQRRARVVRCCCALVVHTSPFEDMLSHLLEQNCEQTVSGYLCPEAQAAHVIGLT